MDFSPVPLTDEDRAFADGVRDFLRTHVTGDVIRRDRESGDNFDESVHLAMGAAGYLEREFRSEGDGGFTRVQRRIWELEKRRARAPWVIWGTTALVARALLRFGSAELVDEILPGVFTGHHRLCLGYTEPEGGSDIATCKTRASRSGSGWVVNGSKMYTTGAHVCQYVFLLTNTDPSAPKHRNLTMFLVPLDSQGIEIQGIRTVDGERTNVVYFDHVDVDDKYRLGEVNAGWSVLQEPLSTEHGRVDAAADGLQDVSILEHQGGFLTTAFDAVTATVAQSREGRPTIDDAVAYRLGRSCARIEAAMSTPGMFGRVAISQAMRDVSTDLMDIAGAASVLPGADEQASADYIYRLAPLSGIYGGTLEVFRNMIAQHVLGLGKPDYRPAPVRGPGTT